MISVPGQRARAPGRRPDLPDGLIEETDKHGEPLEVEGLLALVGRFDPSRPDALPASLLEAVRARRDEALADDTSILVLRRIEEGTSLRDELLAPLRFLGHELGLTSGRSA